MIFQNFLNRIFHRKSSGNSSPPPDTGKTSGIEFEDTNMNEELNHSLMDGEAASSGEPSLHSMESAEKEKSIDIIPFMDDFAEKTHLKEKTDHASIPFMDDSAKKNLPEEKADLPSDTEITSDEDFDFPGPPVNANSHLLDEEDEVNSPEELPEDAFAFIEEPHDADDLLEKEDEDDEEMEESEEETEEEAEDKEREYTDDIFEKEDTLAISTADESLVPAAAEPHSETEIFTETEFFDKDPAPAEPHNSEAEILMEILPAEGSQAEISHTISTSSKKKKKEKKTRSNPMGIKECFTNRELSWLQFNERVLNEAGNPRVPLAERLAFASIYQSNLDEFFMVRVGSLMAQIESGEKVKENKTKMTSKQQVKAILKHAKELELKKGQIYEQLLGELEPQGIRIINFNRLSQKEGIQLEQYFDHFIAPYLSPMIVSSQQPFPFLINKQLYALVTLKSRSGKKRVGLVPCTNGVFKRLIEIPTRPGTYLLSEELILHFVSKVFSNYTVEEKTLARITRNADIDMDTAYDEDMDFRETMAELLKVRKRLSPVRLEISRDINKKVLKSMTNYLGIDERQILRVDTPLDLSFLFQLQSILHNKPEICYTKRSPRLTPALNLRESILDQIEKKDVLLSYPFESIRPFLQMLHEAAYDDSVVSIKMTLYRVASRSKVIESLIEAAENGKEVLVLMELRARFDEENNIDMSRRLEDAGVHIIYGLEDYKVHSKLCLITRKTDTGLSYITQIGTGNYNEKTATLYTDLCLMTSHPGIGADAAHVFAALSCNDTVEEIEHLLVAPHCLQNRILEMMDAEIAKAQVGDDAYIGIKVNSLTDKDIMKKMIEASQAGVRIELIIRGICCLKPGIPDKTDNITVISVVGRFLEHSRIYRFGVGDAEKIYIASADFMTRNTLRRVEVAVPIYDYAIRDRIRHIFDTIMADDEKGKEQLSDGSYVDRQLGDVKLNSQEVFYEESYAAAGDNAVPANAQADPEIAAEIIISETASDTADTM